MKIGTSILGLVMVLAWWTFVEKKPVSTGSTTKMPVKILGGGGSQVVIEVEVNGPAQLGFMGSLPRKPSGDQPIEEDSENMSPGMHSWTVELGKNASGTFDLRALNPQVGNKLKWRVTLDGKEIANETDTLDKPLQANEAQFLQVGTDRKDDDEKQRSDDSN